MDNRWRIGAVSYLNTRPLLYGMEHTDFQEQILLVKDYPAQIAQKLIDGTIDIGLVPVAVLQSLPNAQIISKYSIGAIGAVASVGIFSELPMEQIERVYLDYQSRTSVQLAKILLAQYWKQDVDFLPAPDDYMDHIGGNTAGVIIGDRALNSLKRYRYFYDLGKAWQAHTRLPFVFAAWVTTKELPIAFMEAFDAANAYGLSHLEEVIAHIPLSEQNYDLYKYYTENISYELTDAKREGMGLFLKLMNTDLKI